MEPRVRLTGFIIVKNGERLFDQCLESLSFCDRILVVDSFSTDRTEEIARKHGVIFIQNAWPGFPQQHTFGTNWLIENIPSDWVVSLDSDEIISPELRASILKAVENPQGHSAFSMPRRTWYYDRFLKHGGCYPDRLYRLYRPECIRIDNYGAHQQVVPSGSCGNIDGDILHYSYYSFENQLEKLNIYAATGALDLEKKGKKGGVFQGLVHGTWRFVDMYIRKLGFLDGRAGFLMAAHQSFYTFLKYIRVRQGLWGAPFDHGLPNTTDHNHSESQRG